MKSRKRGFLIIDVLIAFAIFSLCILPLLAPHFLILRSEIDSLRTAQLERWADSSYADVKELLYEREIPWRDLQLGYQHDLRGLASVTTGPNELTYYRRHFEIRGRKQYTKTKRNYRLLEIEIFFTEEKDPRQHRHGQYSYMLFLKRRPPFAEDNV